jgi:adenylate cyclase
MAYEIERKFLLCSDAWRAEVHKTIHIKQDYLCNTGKASLRVRVTDDQAYISSKTMTFEIRRHEFEYEIPRTDAEFMIQYMCTGNPLIKQRHLVKVKGHTWEIDVFEGANAGLVVAEIELRHESESFSKPEWIGAEVSAEQRYFNMNLIEHPYSEWE